MPPMHPTSGQPQLLAAFLVLAFGSLACGQEKPPVWQEMVQPEDDQSPRLARLALPPSDRWIPEKNIPARPQGNPQMVIWELSHFPPGARPSSEHNRDARAFVEACYEAAEKNEWHLYDRGIKDGYWLPSFDRAHYQRDDYMLDDVVLDPQRPEVLMYYRTPSQGKQLVGFMFFAEDRGKRGPQFGGPMTIWHYHIWRDPQCVVDETIAVGFAQDGHCERGQPFHRSREMIHVWLIDHPEGPFASSMYLPDHVLAEGLRKRRAERGW